jgi:hypothetical protein
VPWDAVNGFAPDASQPALGELCFAVDELVEVSVQRARDRDEVARLEDDLRLLDLCASAATEMLRDLRMTQELVGHSLARHDRCIPPGPRMLRRRL